ncbi:MAG: LLM class flavin-dependent oxidoreductase [SAR202 cluster bacterium]|nr:LLM class flavin-dependent oxidoreductase [SAR202 cluster bacterium]
MTRIGFALASVMPMQDLMDLASEAEDAGYESVWLTEGQGKDVFTTLAAIATVTQRTIIGPGVSPIFIRTPTLTAMTVTALDELSQGRAALGLGTGAKAGVERAHGVPFDHPLGRMREYVEVVRGVLTQENFSYEGRFYRVKGVRRDVSPFRPKVPIYIAALGLRMAELAGEVADGVLLNIATPEYARRAVEAVRQGAVKAGRDPSQVDIGCFITTSVAQDRKAARESARRRIARFAANPFYGNMFRAAGFGAEVDGVMRAAARGDRDGTYAQVSDAMVDAAAAHGSPGECREKVAEFVEAGVTLPLIQANNVARDRMAALWTTLETMAPGG